MTKKRAVQADPSQQLAEANAAIAVLRRSVHEEHAGAAQAYLKLEEERARREKVEADLARARAIIAKYRGEVA
jgi:hypothetical protein